MDLHEEIGDQHTDIRRSHRAEMDVYTPFALCHPFYGKTVCRQKIKCDLRLLYLVGKMDIAARKEILKGPHIFDQCILFKIVRIGLYAAKEGCGKSCGWFNFCGTQVFGHDACGCAVIRPYVGKRREILSLRVVVNYDSIGELLKQGIVIRLGIE